MADVSDAATVYDDSRSASAADAAVSAGEIDDGASIPPAAVDLTESVVDKLTDFFEGLTYDQISSYYTPGGKKPEAFAASGVNRLREDFPELLELEIPSWVRTQMYSVN